jgi:hypothetical protein
MHRTMLKSKIHRATAHNQIINVDSEVATLLRAPTAA